MAAPIRPRPAGDGAKVPDQPARVTGVRQDLPDDFYTGEPITLQLTLDRPLSAYEVRVLDEQGLGWETFTDIEHMTVELTHGINEDTLGKIQNVLDSVNEKAAEKAHQAATTRSLLSTLIDKWGM